MSKYIPTKIALSVFDIDYNELYAAGKRFILFDLDNTLISYNQMAPDEKLLELGNKIKKIGFEVYILSNNHKKRISQFINEFPVSGYGELMKKPFVYKIKSFLSNKKINDYSQIIMIGDQLVTDILCANRLGVDSILVKSISRDSEKFYTTINRLREPLILKSFSKHNKEYASQIYELIKKEKKNG